jgi:hypothetical protein
MARPLSFKESLVVWRSMAENTRARLAEMPEMREFQEELVAHVERSQRLLALASRYEARLREANRQKKLAFAEGRKLRNRLALALRGKLGPHDPQLLAFGVPPQPLEPRRNRLTKAERARRAAEAAQEAADGGTPEGEPPAVN